MKKISIILSICLLSFGSFAFVESDYFNIVKSIDTFAKAYREVCDSYVDEVEPAGLMRKGLNAMLAELDPYTNYISEAQIETYRLNKSGAAGNIGVSLTQQNKQIIIKEIVEEQGAFLAGLQVGDRLISIDGKSTEGRSIEEVEQILQGQPASEVSISYQRYGSNATETVTVTRDTEEATSVPYYGMLDSTTAYVKLKTFLKRGCTSEVITAIEDLKKNNDVQQIVFDLRHNGGGLLAEAITMVNIFAPKNETVVKTYAKLASQNKEYKTPNDPKVPDLPLAVLIDERSASASEIFAGNMQDLDRGIVVGTQSFGKGLVQNTTNVGYGARLKLTISRYHTASDRCVQAVDYSGRYSDGIKNVPDSLKKAFKTRNGRTVYDGSGVQPDVEVPKEPFADITQALLDQLIIMDFATEYYQKNDSIAPPETFALTDQDFENFIAFANERTYTYQTESEKVVAELSKSAKEEQYKAAVAETVTRLKEKITEQKKKDIYTFKNEIMRQLQLEIIGRYYYQNGKVAASLSTDSNVEKALEILYNPEEYNKILGK